MIKGHTPTALATTSTSSGMTILLLMMAFFGAGRKAIQSRLSTPLSLSTMNSVIEQRSRSPRKHDAVRWRHRLKRRKSNNGNSISLYWYPLPRKNTYASTGACGPPGTNWTFGPSASMIPSTSTTSPFTLLLNWSRIDTQTHRNWLLSQHWMNTQICSPRSLNSMMR